MLDSYVSIAFVNYMCYSLRNRSHRYEVVATPTVAFRKDVGIMAQKKKPNFSSYSPRRSGSQSFVDRVANLGAPKKSKGQSGSGGNSRKTHDTKGKNTHGRRSW